MRYLVGAESFSLRRIRTITIYRLRSKVHFLFRLMSLVCKELKLRIKI